MKETTFSQNGGPLLHSAISKFNPEVFSHPVWMRFGKKEAAFSLRIVDDLLRAVKSLQQDDPSTACQVLLICAVYQNYAGQHFGALKTAQQALALAQHANLFKEAVWAIWGRCAISIQQRNYEQASNTLVDLQAVLSEQNEWILADFVDVLRQCFLRPIMIGVEKHSEALRDHLFTDMLTFTFDWLQNWGFSDQVFEPEFEGISGQPISHATKQATLSQSFFSIQHWQGRWHNLMLAIRGELRFQWTDTQSQSIKNGVSFWRAILSYLHFHPSSQNIDTQAAENIPQIHNIALLPSAKESAASKTKPRRKKPASTVKKVSRNQHSAQANTVVPVTVHMLGTFSMTIGDSKVKMPASRGLSVLKYLLLHHKQNISRDVLMDIFWPEAEPEMARNNLNVALHSLRKAVRDVTFLPMIRFEEGSYSFEPNLQVWLDVEEFERCVKAGQRLEERNQLTAAINEYEAAVSLYQGDFLEQNPYEEWTTLDRERLRIAYLDTLDRLSQIYFEEERYSACRSACQLILMRDPCREDAHCLLMRCYSRQGQHHLALRQYQMCAEALRSELQVEPAPEATQLYNRIRRREQV